MEAGALSHQGSLLIPRVMLCWAVWDCVGLCGAMWGYVGLCGAVWGCVGLGGAGWGWVGLWCAHMSNAESA
jgi:hypothetical protein